MTKTRLRSNLHFAFHKEASKVREDIPPNKLEQIGNLLSWVAYEFKSIFRNAICDPRAITICLTLFFMILTALFFYPSNTWYIMRATLILVFTHINWGYVRFSLWVLSELTIIGLGLRAFGRFCNKRLIEHHKTIS